MYRHEMSGASSGIVASATLGVARSCFTNFSLSPARRRTRRWIGLGELLRCRNRRCDQEHAFPAFIHLPRLLLSLYIRHEDLRGGQFVAVPYRQRPYGFPTIRCDSTQHQRSSNYEDKCHGDAWHLRRLRRPVPLLYPESRSSEVGIENVVRRAYLPKMASTDGAPARSERRLMEKNAQEVHDLCTRIIAELPTNYVLGVGRNVKSLPQTLFFL
jgi:hypothetical protein